MLRMAKTKPVLQQVHAEMVDILVGHVPEHGQHGGATSSEVGQHSTMWPKDAAFFQTSTAAAKEKCCTASLAQRCDLIAMKEFFSRAMTAINEQIGF